MIDENITFVLLPFEYFVRSLKFHTTIVKFLEVVTSEKTEVSGYLILNNRFMILPQRTTKLIKPFFNYRISSGRISN